MTWLLVILVVMMIGAAIAIQVYYVRGLQKSGVEVTRAAQFISWFNIGLLALVGIGLVALLLLGKLTAMGM